MGGDDRVRSHAAPIGAPECRLLVPTVCTVRTTGEASAIWDSGPRTPEWPVCPPRYRPPRLRLALGTGSPRSSVPGNFGEPAAVSSDHFRKRRGDARYIRNAAGRLP